VTLTFRTLPPSTNHLYAQRGNARFLKPEVRAAKEAIGWEARSQYHGKPLTCPLAVSVALYWPDRRKHDVDNIKALLDACTGILWEDDGQIIDLHITKDFDKEAPRVVMAVREVTETEKRQETISRQLSD